MSLHVLSGVVYMNPSYMCRKYHQLTGSSLSAYIANVRMKKARELLLLDPKESISKIAPAIGFRSSAYFSTFFKRHTGLTPQQYRQQLNEQKK